MPKKLLSCLLFQSCIFAFCSIIFADASNTGAQSVTFTIPAVSVFSITGDVSFGTFSTPVAGSDFARININNGQSYNITNNAGSGNRKITGQLTAPLPAGLTLGLGMNPPYGSGGISAGIVNANSSSATNLVTQIGNGAYTNVQVFYGLTAAVATTAVGSGTITVTYTLASQ